MSSDGTTRGEAAAHVLAREMGRRTRAIHTRIDEVEEARRQAEEAAKLAEREALSAWLLSRSDLTDGARAAILRAMGVAETAGSV